MIRSLAHVCLGVSDVGRSLAFYRDVLGLAPAYDFRTESGSRIGHCMHLGGGTFLELFKSDQTGGEQGHRHFCLLVDDIRAAVAELRARGAEVTDVGRGTDRSWNAWLADPDDNRIELQQYTPESKQRPWVS
jgi:catechol 2,3-dioxygenase-like lactoylglutathione lyase family enzyme